MKFDPKYTPPFRVGRKQKKAVLDSTGREVIFFKDSEVQAKLYCDYLNESSICECENERKEFEQITNKCRKCGLVLITNEEERIKSQSRDHLTDSFILLMESKDLQRDYKIIKTLSDHGVDFYNIKNAIKAINDEGSI